MYPQISRFSHTDPGHRRQKNGPITSLRKVNLWKRWSGRFETVHTLLVHQQWTTPQIVQIGQICHEAYLCFKKEEAKASTQWSFPQKITVFWVHGSKNMSIHERGRQHSHVSMQRIVSVYLEHRVTPPAATHRTFRPTGLFQPNCCVAILCPLKWGTMESHSNKSG